VPLVSLISLAARSFPCSPKATELTAPPGPVSLLDKGSAAADSSRVSLSDVGLTLLAATMSRAASLPPRLDTWDQAIEALFRLGTEKPVLVVLDEFPYMAHSTSGLPSIIQHALSPRGMARTASRTRLILCGSSITFMAQLMSGSAALFGRARINLVVQAFDFRMAVLLLFSGAGFTRELEAEATSSGGTIQLVGLDRLYFGS
jgi:hypothetical protein